MKGTRRWIGASDASSAAGACVPPGRCARPPLAGLCDTHVHVLDPQRFPFHAKRLYTPGPATVAQMQAMHARLGINRVVVVQNSVYGTDNRCLVDTLHQIGPQARGVCAMGPDTTKEDIDALDRAGVRGVRLNFSVHHTNDPTIILRALAVERHIPPHWHVHINADLAVLASIADRLGGMRAPVILDHFAHACAVKGVNQPGLSEIIALMQAKKAIVKLSGPYQISQRADYDDVQAIAQRFIAASARITAK